MELRREWPAEGSLSPSALVCCAGFVLPSPIPLGDPPILKVVVDSAGPPSRMLWTFASVERRTSQPHPHIVKKLSVSCVRWTARDRARAWFCARDLCWTMKLSGVFTDVRACIVPGTGTVSARSFTKSEYTQSQGDPKGTLFDAKLDHRRYSPDHPSGVLTPLLVPPSRSPARFVHARDIATSVAHGLTHATRQPASQRTASSKRVDGPRRSSPAL